MMPKCEWIGNDEFCQKDALLGKSYCEKHYERVYLVLFPEMANHIIEKELKSEGLSN